MSSITARYGKVSYKYVHSPFYVLIFCAIRSYIERMRTNVCIDRDQNQNQSYRLIKCATIKVHVHLIVLLSSLSFYEQN